MKYSGSFYSSQSTCKYFNSSKSTEVIRKMSVFSVRVLYLQKKWPHVTEIWSCIIVNNDASTYVMLVVGFST